MKRLPLKLILFHILLLYFRLPLWAQPKELENVETGDLIFLDWDCGPLCEAIKAVTNRQFNVNGHHMSHVGIIEKDQNGKVFIWEAIPTFGVVKSDLGYFLWRVKGGEQEPGGYYVGRINEDNRDLSKLAVGHAKLLEGQPYGPSFRIDGPGYFCSKLLHEVYRSANGGSEVFKTSPMKFGIPGSRARKVWEDYYKGIGEKLPLNEPGISPLGIYLHGQKHFFK